MNPHRKYDDLPAARRHLDQAISALIDPKPHTIRRDDGTTEIVWLDPLLVQLFASVSGQTGAGSSVVVSTSPIWAEILDLIEKITSVVVGWEPEGSSLYGRLRAINGHTWTVEETPHVESIAKTLDGYATQISDKLNPEPVVYLMSPDTPDAAKCPACDTQYVYRDDPSDNSEPKRQPALKVTSDGCHCQHCHYEWAPYRLRLLAAALGYPLPAGVLE